MCCKFVLFGRPFQKKDPPEAELMKAVYGRLTESSSTMVSPETNLFISYIPRRINMIRLFSYAC